MAPRWDVLLAVDKPAGLTSHDVVARVRRVLSIPKAGHTGTLDPAATGVLVLCLGRATRLSAYLTAHDKRYSARLHLGVVTDTLDAEGTVVRRCGDLPSREVVVEMAGRFVGRIDQVPPMYSARHVAGRRLHELARTGIAVERDARPVTVHTLTVLKYDPPFVDLDVRCGAGTYIRALADDLGRALGCGAHLAALRRTEVGAIGLSQCVSLDGLDAARASSAAIDPSRALSDFPEARLDADRSARFANGNAVSLGAGPEGGALVRVIDEAGCLLGIGKTIGRGLRPVRVIRDREACGADARP